MNIAISLNAFQYNDKWKVEQVVKENNLVIFKVIELMNYDPDDTEEIIEFTVKGDGCANVEYNKNDVLTHFCHKKHLTDFYELQMFLYNRAEAILRELNKFTTTHQYGRIV